MYDKQMRNLQILREVQTNEQNEVYRDWIYINWPYKNYFNGFYNDVNENISRKPRILSYPKR